MTRTVLRGGRVFDGLLGVDDELGTVEIGKLADLAVIAGDPYDFRDLADRVEQVWQGGGRVA